MRRIRDSLIFSTPFDTSRVLWARWQAVAQGAIFVLLTSIITKDMFLIN
ncbi:hypothetical protein Daudx_0458 [Candidatus Desulforudis audaxviator]|nr:hypothetical protein Daudx_0458 [Candidatus Desulforudis audaxviator]